MNQPNFAQWNEMAKKVQEPFKAMTDLNIKTLQALSYLKPEELNQVKKPEELFEKQISLAVENGHKALNYLQESFNIIEKAMFGLINETQQATEKK